MNARELLRSSTEITDDHMFRISEVIDECIGEREAELHDAMEEELDAAEQGVQPVITTCGAQELRGPRAPWYSLGQASWPASWRASWPVQGLGNLGP